MSKTRFKLECRNFSKCENKVDRFIFSKNPICFNCDNEKRKERALKRTRKCY